MKPKVDLKLFFFSLFLLLSGFVFSQNVTVDGSYMPTQLINNVLINSGCIQNVKVTNTGGINHFDRGKKSMGYFKNNSGSFPFKEGIVLTTGELEHVPGPNTSLSDDGENDNWKGDTDLESYLGINHTTNATLIEFDFTPTVSNTIRFNYIFTSEEYRRDNEKTCVYSDAFAFLIKEKSGGNYTNIAVLPNTRTPVMVTTVHPDIAGGCTAKNEKYFGQFNDKKAPINFNGRTKVLTAKATVTPGTTYHIKLVIADSKNYRYDSAVFIEGGSFTPSADLGPDIMLSPGKTVTLSPKQTNITPQGYQWYRVEANNQATLIPGETAAMYKVTAPGIYRVVVSYGSNCKAEDEVKVSYVDFNGIPNSIIISSCFAQQNGNYVYNLPSFEPLIINNEDYFVSNYFKTKVAAENNERGQEVRFPENYEGLPGGEVYARVEPKNGTGTIAKVVTINLAKGADYAPISLYTCAANSMVFNLKKAESIIEKKVGYIDSDGFYKTHQGAATENPEAKIKEGVIEKYKVSSLPKAVFYRMSDAKGCKGVVEIKLKALPHPQINPAYTPPILCELGANNSIIIHAGIKGDESKYSYQWGDGTTTATRAVTKSGKYTVTITQKTTVRGEIRTCSVQNTILVKAIQKPRLSYKLLGELGHQKVQIIAKGNGDYLFKLDGEPFSKTDVYPVDTGKHVIYAKDSRGKCGMSSLTFHVVSYMKFFSPNNDGYNDEWKIIGLGQGQNEPSAPQHIYIFNRYGKLLKEMKPNEGWDGTFHGEPLYEDDYWFKIVYNDGSTFTGHFSLLR